MSLCVATLGDVMVFIAKNEKSRHLTEEKIAPVLFLEYMIRPKRAVIIVIADIASPG